MGEHTRERTAELLGVRADGVAAAFAVGKGYHAIHVRRQRLAVEAACDQLGGVRRAVAGGDYRDIVARAYRAILALVSKKRGSRATLRERLLAGRELVIELQFLKSQVVRVDVAAGRDSFFSAADDLAVAPHDFALGNGGQCDLVAGWDIVADGKGQAFHT